MDDPPPFSGEQNTVLCGTHLRLLDEQNSSNDEYVFFSRRGFPFWVETPGGYMCLAVVSIPSWGVWICHFYHLWMVLLLLVVVVMSLELMVLTVVAMVVFRMYGSCISSAEYVMGVGMTWA